MKNRISHFRKSRPHMMMVTFHLRNVRLIFFSEEFPASEEVFASTAELGSVNCSILALLWSYVIASTFCSFMHSIPSFPYFAGWRLCVHLQPPLKNMLRRPLRRYVIRADLWKLLKFNDFIVLVKKDKLTPHGDQRLQRIIAGWGILLPPKGFVWLSQSPGIANWPLIP